MKLNAEGLPEFEQTDFLSELASYHAARANVLLHDWLKTQPQVWGDGSVFWRQDMRGFANDYTAYLVGVRKLEGK